ncbi:3-oxoacyl-[acyl-carrier-protein] synthase III C-terminal domain-containing protein [Nannocystis sp. SCPEA4]|uniref:3-oxoacyl-ACP synthase III family protein n=1 Tax=Nannocystis sp. SCPEA4 TaxID=2996787 RepID=UPI00226E3507|nr:3-oxoacyl-[acyl-carrier-protein] synthase III C-terminal domain-containing protein [Nannocystis sp. SCPEA4]MCY1059143.1 3-ketoacyl-ACP synthase [Nannocystis sp. SCPEA4]
MTFDYANLRQRRPTIVGAGAYVPDIRMSTARIARIIPGWTPERIVDRTGIHERRYLWDIDDDTGKAIEPARGDGSLPTSGVDMSEIALRKALQAARLRSASLDAIFVVTCTPDRPSFGQDAMALHRRLDCRADCYAMVFDSGCGGTMYVFDMVAKMVAAGAIRTAAIVGSNFTSSMVDRDLYTQSIPLDGSDKSIGAFLSAYVFGDGAGAIILQGEDDGERGVVASVAGNEHLDLVFRPGGGALLPPCSPRSRPIDTAFVVNGALVQQSYLRCMRQSLDHVLARASTPVDAVRRYYMHQPNQRLLEHFAASMGMRPDQLASNVARHGNTSSAGMLILLAEDIERGAVALGSGDLVAFAAIGAGAHVGAQLVRL